MPSTPRKILCPFELQSSSAAGLRAARALASTFGAEVMALHVVSDNPAGAHGDAQAPCDVTLTTSASAQVGAADASGQATMVAGPFVPAVRDASRSGIDLIVLDAGAVPNRPAAVVTTVLDVIRSTSCPVYFVPSTLRDVDVSVAPTRLLCAIDFSVGSVVALAHAAAWAKATNASVTLVHVVEGSPSSTIAPFSSLAVGARTETHAEALGKLAELVSMGWASGERPEIVVRDGDAPRQILAVSQERRVDAIMLGARVRTPFGTLLFGSSVSDVLRAAACPVLLAR